MDKDKKFIPWGSDEHRRMSPKTTGLVPPGEYQIRIGWEMKPVMDKTDRWQISEYTVVVMEDVEHGNGD